MDMTNILGALTGNDAIGTIAEKFNIDSSQVSSVITNALPSFLGAMQQNASTEGGAAALAKALGDHAGEAGDIINNLKGADLTDGSKEWRGLQWSEQYPRCHCPEHPRPFGQRPTRPRQEYGFGWYVGCHPWRHVEQQ